MGHPKEKCRLSFGPPPSHRPEDLPCWYVLPLTRIKPVEVAIEGIEMVAMGENDQSTISRVGSGKKNLPRPGCPDLLSDGGGNVDAIMKCSKRLNDFPSQRPKEVASSQNGRIPMDFPSTLSASPSLKTDNELHEFLATSQYRLVVRMNGAFLFPELRDLRLDVLHLCGESRLLRLLPFEKRNLPLLKIFQLASAAL